MHREIENLEFAITVTHSLLTHFNGKELNMVEEFCVCAIDRLSQSAISLKKLSEDVSINHRLEFGCAIIIRSVLSDALYIINAFTIAVENHDENIIKEKLSKFCFESLSDSVNHLIKNSENIENADQRKEQFKWIAENYDRYLKPKSNSIEEPETVEKGNKNAKYLAGRIRGNKNFNTYKDIYNAFLYYSKYEHFGIVYHDFQGSGHQSQIEKLKKSINRLFPWLLLCTAAILYTLNKENLHVRYCLEDLEKYLLDQQSD